MVSTNSSSTETPEQEIPKGNIRKQEIAKEEPKQEESKKEKPREPAYPKIEAAIELLQQVLVNLPMRDLVAHQRVSKKWKAAILGWSELQKALFFQPVEDLQLSLVEDSVAPAGGLRPLKCTSQRKCPRDLAGYPVGDDWYYPSFDDVPRGITRWAVDRSDEREYRIVINPLLGVEKPWDQIYFEDDERGKDKFRREAYKRREASWRYMFFSQPPLKEALVSHQGTAHFHVIRAKDRSKGLTLGDVHDSKRAFKASIQSVWGEDGFSPGVPEDSSACDVLEKLGLDPAPEKHDEASAD